jgi:cell division transport system permease protein
MKINTFFYSIQQGFKNIGRNKMFSLASMATMAACIFMFGIFYILVFNVNEMVHDAEESVAITVFFDEGLPEDQIKIIGEDIKNRSEVRETVFVSAEEAWESFKDVYFEGNEEYAAGFSENPLANSANYEIYLKDISKQSTLVKYLEGIEGVRDVKQSQSIAESAPLSSLRLGFPPLCKLKESFRLILSRYNRSSAFGFAHKSFKLVKS